MLKRPRSEPPPTKIWPLPLVLAAIEAKDSIYRGWAVQKIRDYAQAGKHYANACAFAEEVQGREEQRNARVDLAAISHNMPDNFII
ncbi:putative fungal transcriptional regulatory protein [Phaeoacremonium minimum UCRPA7]|uniref:Putative fungal transcriptional regulatory protein n=1 Tax=Phaeoacremonium minimum (strain UCR-PA7) TaxID=1286976 RepID=R8BQD0_PHAM7|nr:putative fungal transcriptional regulatory protein [Phaeoacremonium minimum UCRPA7]EOO01557.1 putative fungal transcriptional regulatory protein [Phaeoacremonium minimum UCRPA7]